MNATEDLDRLVSEWLESEASSSGSERVLAVALGRVATSSQDRGALHRLITYRLGRSSLRWALFVMLVLTVVIVVAVVGTRPRAPDPPVPSSFTAGPSPTELRMEATATVLVDGSVLLFGGYGSPMPESVELLEPANPTFRPAGSILQTRFGHTATLLSDGRVLVVGGSQIDAALPTAEVWDPANETTEPAGSMDTPRVGHTATLLADGRVLIVGGRESYSGASGLASAELWDPDSATFSPAGSLPHGLADHTATRLSDGRLLIVGGDATSCAPGAGYLWDPGTGAFESVPGLGHPRSHHTATVTLDGRVLIVGGADLTEIRPNQSPILIEEAVLWDPDSQTGSRAGVLGSARWYHTATLLLDGRVLLVGGSDRGSTAELWIPDSRSFVPAGSLPYNRYPHTAALLPDGRVLISGAWNQLWDPSAPLPDSAVNGSLPTPGTLATAPPRAIAGGSPNPSPTPCGP